MDKVGTTRTSYYLGLGWFLEVMKLKQTDNEASHLTDLADFSGWQIMFFKFEVFSEICFIQVALSTSSNSEALGTTLRLITLLETNLMMVLMKNKMV